MSVRWLSIRSRRFRGDAFDVALEEWRTVGATGETVTFAGLWANTNAATNNSAGFWRDPWGIVHLKGVVDTGVANSTIFTLPVGYRPERNEVFVVWNSALVAGRVTVTSAGVVTESNSTRANAAQFLSLDGITFRTVKK